MVHARASGAVVEATELAFGVPIVSISIASWSWRCRGRAEGLGDATRSRDLENDVRAAESASTGRVSVEVAMMSCREQKRDPKKTQDSRSALIQSPRTLQAIVLIIDRWSGETLVTRANHVLVQ